MAATVTSLFDVDSPVDVPLTPPAHWFDPPETFDPHDGLIQIELDGPNAGRVVAMVAPEGENILRDNFDWQPPQSPTNYEFAHTGTTFTDDGSKIRTANIGGNINHADPSWGMRAAVDLYANTASKTIRCRYHDVPGVGIVATGALWPGLSKRDAIEAMGMAVSGDWRMVQSIGSRDMAGSQLVNAPALRPLPRGVNRSAGWRPARFRPIAASLDSNGNSDIVYGSWVTDTEPVDVHTPMFAPSGIPADLSARVSIIEHALAKLIDAAVTDTHIDHDDDDLFNTVFQCPACSPTTRHQCTMCHHTGIEPYNPLTDHGYIFEDYL